MILDIQRAINRISIDFDRDRFTSGDCHHLAIALLLINNNAGALLACIRSEVDENAKVFSETYSHMVYESPESLIWDIDGQNADFRWEGLWPDSTVFDKDGLCNQFKWINVAVKDIQPWLRAHFSCYDPELVEQLTASARGSACEANQSQMPSVQTQRMRM